MPNRQSLTSSWLNTEYLPVELEGDPGGEGSTPQNNLSNQADEVAEELYLGPSGSKPTLSQDQASAVLNKRSDTSDQGG